MVELALTLPLLLILLLIAIDFGRVFFGWIGVQNAARIGASYASAHASAWSAPDTPLKVGFRQEFTDQIQRDARSINCELQAIPIPVFSAVGGIPAGDLGSHASVTLQCDFDLVTGGFGGALNDPLRIGANAIFPVRSGAVANLPTPVPTPPCTDKIVPDLVNPSPEKVSEARAEWTSAGFTGSFTPATGNDNKKVLTQNQTPGACLPATTTVTVTHN